MTTPAVLQSLLRANIRINRGVVASSQKVLPLVRGCGFAFQASSSSSLPPLDTSRRHKGIQMHPESIGNLIMPGEVVYKKTIAGKERWQPVTLEYGYFWMLRDLRQTNDKPFISNTQLIPENEAKVFPYLAGLSCLDNSANNSSEKTTIDIPAYWLRKNRTRDPSAQCTLVGIAFRDYGYLQLNDWLRPFAEAFDTNDRVETVRLNLNEGYFNRYLLKGLITSSMRRNTPPKELSSTFIHFAADLQNFRDPIRAHNVMPGYIYLLDGLGRVRFAATGPASLEEVETVKELAHELLRPTIKGSSKRSHKR